MPERDTGDIDEIEFGRRGPDSPVRLALADDEALLRRGLRVVLEADPRITVVAEAADGAELLDAIRRHRPDVVLIDVQMPGTDGLTALRRIRALPDQPAAAMLTLAFAQIVWAICFKWNEVTGGEQGMPEIPYPSFDWVDRVATVLPLVGGYRTSDYYYFTCLVLVGVCIWLLRRIVGSPFGRMLTTIRENAERAEFIGVNVRRYELAAFVIAGAFAGLAGGLFGIFNRGVFPDFAYWTKSSEVLIMTLLGGMGTFWGPAVGALALIWLNQQIVSYTEYWPLILGSILVVLLFVFPGGLAGAMLALWRRLQRRPAGA